MKAREVMKLLNICRTTLYHYTKDNIIKHTKLSNGYYDYDEHSVLQFIKKDNRSNVIYARVSTYKQKNDLTNQINKLQTYCKDNNINIHHVYSEIASGIDLDRTELSKLFDDVFSYKIKNIYISNKDRLTRLSFKTLESLLNKFNTNIIVINNIHNQNNDNEIFEELISLMHIFSTTLYSNRRKNKINIYKQDIENFISDDTTVYNN
jgi:predicted site-specific integrase-resolvase